MNSPSSCDNWRWLHQLEKTSASLWQMLSLLEKVEFDYRNQATSYQGELNLEHAFLDKFGYFVTSQPSLILESAKIDRIYLAEASGGVSDALEFDFFERTSALRLHNCSPHIMQHLEKLFGWELKPESPALQKSRNLALLPTCQCCVDASHARRATAERNPIFSIMKIVIEAREELTIKLGSNGLKLLTSMNPLEVSEKNGLITLFGDSGQFRLDVGLLHGILIKKRNSQCELSLVNSHGVTFGSLSAPASLFQMSWHACLSNAEGVYEAIA